VSVERVLQIERRACACSERACEVKRKARWRIATRPFVLSNLRTWDGVAEIASFIEEKGGLGA
jgi:hypothetical protein